MNSLIKIAKTLTGEIVISGQLKAHPDLSFDDLKKNLHLQVFEVGRPLSIFQEISPNTIAKEFQVIFSLVLENFIFPTKVLRNDCWQVTKRNSIKSISGLFPM